MYQNCRLSTTHPYFHEHRNHPSHNTSHSLHAILHTLLLQLDLGHVAQEGEALEGGHGVGAHVVIKGHEAECRASLGACRAGHVHAGDIHICALQDLQHLGDSSRSVLVLEGEDVVALGLEGEQIAEVVHLHDVWLVAEDGPSDPAAAAVRALHLHGEQVPVLGAAQHRRLLRDRRLNSGVFRHDRGADHVRNQAQAHVLHQPLEHHGLQQLPGLLGGDVGVAAPHGPEGHAGHGGGGQLGLHRADGLRQLHERFHVHLSRGHEVGHVGDSEVVLLVEHVAHLRGDVPAHVHLRFLRTLR
eukprot:Colp12_sorted_trinity150504_noHs@12555